MKNTDWEKRMQKVLSPERYRHCLGVAKLAERLAGLHGVDEERLYVAGLLHDVAKELTPEESERILRETDEDAYREMADMPKLWHAEVSAIMAEREYAIDDEEVLDAVRYHPTGHPEFRTLGDILFVSDYCDPERPIEGHKEIARLAETDLNGAVLEVIERKTEYLRQRGRTIHPRVLEYRQAVVDRGKGRKVENRKIAGGTLIQ